MSDIPAALADALAPSYELRRIIGRGGMATVYLAYDRKHQRGVAIKVLRPDLAVSIGTDRFLKEIQIAARLNHPHILTLHDSGEAGGFLYYVMPFIDGPSLRHRLEHERRFPLGEALAVAAPVADALGYAHRMGVFHRDIKPENILFSQGHPIVADFGIAKAISTAGGANLTRTGFPLGTPGYMSPEQAAGMTDLDERTDVYSLAIVIYEMLVGEIPGLWPSDDAVRAGRFLDAAPSHRSRLAEAGSRVEAALVNAMAIQHGARTATPATLMGHLTTGAVPRRRYSEQEVREIVRRASEIEASNPTAGGAMTIGGIEAVAADVGIAPDLVRSAAEGLAERRPAAATLTPKTLAHRFIGGPTRLVFERVVDAELPETEFPVLVEEIRRILANVGQVSQLGRSFSWATSHPRSRGRDVQVSVSVRTGRTRITVQENMRNLIGAIFGGIGGGVGGGGMGIVIGTLANTVGMPPLLGVLAVPTWLLTVFGVARTSYHYATRGRAPELEDLADRLAALTRELSPAPARRNLPP